MTQPDLFDVGPRAAIRVQRTCTPATIGGGPAGETCGSCKHKVRLPYQGYFYLKCELAKKGWTHGAGSDIKAKWPACSCWEKGN